MNEKNLPNLGTVEQCMEKMKQGYRTFIQSAAMFVTVCDFYSDNKNEGLKLPQNLTDLHAANVIKLSVDDPQYIFESIAVYAALTLDFVSEIKENIENYFTILRDGQDASLSDYDKCCDLLTIKDEFTDLKHDLDEVSSQIIDDKFLENNINDPEYDPNAIERF